MENSATISFDDQRLEMVKQVSAHAFLAAEATGRATLDPRVLAVLGSVPRHEFVPVEMRQYAYLDSPLPIGYDKTISQPFVVGLMSDLLAVEPGDRVLEIGTGLGYQSAILAGLGARVFSMEIIEELAHSAIRRLRDLHIENVEVQVGDGTQGWPEQAPFDKILVAAAPDLIPVPLLNQLKPGGRMIIPAGIEHAQQLLLVKKDADGHANTEEILPVRFSELTGAIDLL